MQFPAPYGGYTLLVALGHGGMAEVFLARKAGPGGFSKLVVIKRILPHLGKEPEFVQMFLDEARLAARLEHPNIVQVFDLGQAADTYFLAMEYLNGENLSGLARRALSRKHPVGGTVAARVVADACEGLHFAHEFREADGTPLSIVHRDVSPQNVFVTYDGRVKVLDFGVAKVATRLAHTKTGTVKGKVSYMSPEQCRGDAIDRRSDVFAVGVVLFEMVSGRRMFRDENEFSLLRKIGSGDFPRPSQIAADAPAPLLAVCERAMAVDPDARFPTARAMKLELDAYVRSTGAENSSEPVAQLMARLFGDDIELRKRLISATDDHDEVFSKIEKVVSDSFPSLRSLAKSGEKTAWERGSSAAAHRRWRAVPTAWVAAGLLGAAVLALGTYLAQAERGAATTPQPPPSAQPAPAVPPAPTAATRSSPPTAAPAPALAGIPERDRKPTAARTRPLPALLSIESQPAGCAVRIGDKPAGLTPLSRHRVEATGPVAVAVECEGYQRAERSVTLTPGEAMTLAVPLTALPRLTGFLTLKTTPWSNVYEGETALGMTPLARVRLPAGQHTLRAVNEVEKAAKTFTVEIRPNENTSLSVDLTAP